MGQPLADCDFNQAACTQLTPSSAERARREHRHPKASNPEETPALDPLENNIRRLRSSAALNGVPPRSSWNCLEALEPELPVDNGLSDLLEWRRL
jgi:hypothetical protein